MKKLLPILVILFSLGGGLAAGFILRAPAEEENTCAEDDAECEANVAEKPEPAKPVARSAPPGTTDFAKLDKQFVVPIVRGERVRALIVAEMAIEVEKGQVEVVDQVEPKLKDAFLRVLFTHAHSGGFDGEFTAEYALDDLRARLFEEAHAILGDIAKDVLITEIVRQDM